MPQEEREKHQLIKLHTGLGGKRILIVESYGIYSNDYFKQTCHLSKISTELMGNFSYYTKETYGEFDGFIIHPEALESWKKKIEEVRAAGKPLVILQGTRADQDSLQMYAAYKELGLPIVNRSLLRLGSKSFFDQTLDLLEKAFAAQNH